MRIWMMTLALVSALLGGAVLASPASAAPECSTVEASIIDRPDSGQNGDWALDTFTRVAEVCDDGNGTFTVTGVDSGTFVTTGPTSPGTPPGVPLAAGIEGTIAGEWSAVVVYSDGIDESFDPNTNVYSTGAWIAKLMGVPDEKVTLSEWRWVYQTWCGEDDGQEAWVNSIDGNEGDITEAPECPEPTPSPSAPPTESASPAPSEAAAAPELPVTGSSLPMVLGGAAILLGLSGAALMVLGRKRRTKFTA